MKKALYIYILLSLFTLPEIKAQYIDFDPTQRIITSEMMEQICDDEIDYIRNEIFARRGYTFSDNKYQTHFKGYDWYKPIGNNENIKLNELESKNVNALKAEKQKRTTRKEAIRQYFSNLNLQEIFEKDVFNETDFNAHNDSFVWMNDIVKRFSFLLELINYDEMTFCGSKGIYSVAINNGFSNNTYEMRVEKDSITLQYGQGSSDLFPDDKRIELSINDSPVGWTRSDEYGEMLHFKIDASNIITYSDFNAVG